MDMQQAATPLFVYIEIVGAAVGVVLLILLLRVVKELGGELASALKSLIGGVALFTLAFALSAVLDVFDLAPMQSTMSSHMGLMLLAMILVVVTANRFARMLR